MKTFLTSVAAIALMGGAAAAQGVVLVPQGEGPAGQQQFILVPVPQDQGAQQGAQQGAGQQGQPETRQRAEARALDLYRRGYQRGIADAASRGPAALDPGAVEQIGRELFERGYMLGLMHARAQITAAETPEPGSDGQASARQGQPGTQQQGLAAAAGEPQAAEAGETVRDLVQQPQDGQDAQAVQQRSAEAGEAVRDVIQPSPADQQGEATQTQAGQSGTTRSQPTESGTSQADAATATGDFPQAIIRTTESGEHGEYLIDANGRAVYLLEADKRGQGEAGARSECYGECAAVWPPVLSQGVPPRALDDADQGMLSMTEREDGTQQVTYDGWPLYYYVEDEGEAQATGQDVHDEWGEWYLLTPEGEKVGHD